MQKKSLKLFLIQNFLIILLCIYISEELLSLLYRLVILPGLMDLFKMQQITISGNGNILIFMIQLLFCYLVSFLPKGASDYLQGFLTDLFGIGIQFKVTSPLYQGQWASLLTVSFLLLLLFLLGLSLLPYIAGTLWYYKTVTGKVNELLEEEKERQLNYERKRNLLLSDIAHDIKTPITTICGYSKALSEGVAQEEKRMDYLNAIYGKALRIDELITLLFEYVKLDSEGFCLHKERMQFYLIDGRNHIYVFTKIGKDCRIKVCHAHSLCKPFLIGLLNPAICRKIISHRLMKQDEVNIGHIQLCQG